MKNFFLNSLVLVCLFSFANSSFAQEKTVTGTVTTLENIVVVNAEVKALSAKVTVLTDSMGNFSISCLPNDKLKISARGFYSKKVKLDETTKEVAVDLKFKSGEKNIDVAEGYGHINEKDKTFAISSIRSKDEFEFAKYSNMYELIDNSSPSVMVRNGVILIRGSNSLKGSSAALIIVDGNEISSAQLATISPLDVKSVDILKDGSSAIYGSRGGNGVVLVTTKKGKNKK